MNSENYFPCYYSVEDLFVTQEKVECQVNTKLLKMGFLDSRPDEDLESGRSVNLPLWYINELKVNNPYFTVTVPDLYKNVHKAVCEAEATNIEMGKWHPFFYEYGRYLTPYDRNHIVGKIIYETLRQRVRHLLDISRNVTNDGKPEYRLDNIEQKLYDQGSRTHTVYTNWLQMKVRNIGASEMVQEHSKKRKRARLSDCCETNVETSSKRPTL